MFANTRRYSHGMVAANHFEQVANHYDSARPAYPDALFDFLQHRGVIGAGFDILEIGAGTGQATTPILQRGCRVTAIEPGPRLAQQLEANAAGVRIIMSVLEDAELACGAFDSAVAATSMHWVDLSTALPIIHDALKPQGYLAVWRTIFGDPRIDTPFRDAVARLVQARRQHSARSRDIDPRPRITELEQGGWFRYVETWSHPWQIDLDVEQVVALFATFSDWSGPELEALRSAALDLGPTIREHYVTHLHVLRRSDSP